MRVRQLQPGSISRAWDDLSEVLAVLQERRERQAGLPACTLLAFANEFGRRLLEDARTQRLEGIAFLASWLRRGHLEKVVQLNLHAPLECLDRFVAVGKQLLAARPRGLVATWLAGNVSTLPFFALVPILLTKNVGIFKLPHAPTPALECLLAVFADTEVDGLCGHELLEAFAFVQFDHRERDLNEVLSLAADVRLIWGGVGAVHALTTLPRQAHCADLVFGPKYSLGVIDRGLVEDGKGLDEVIAAFVRDVAVFDQRACSSPQTIFLERNAAHSLREVGELFARHLRRLPPKADIDAFTTLAIVNARARWALEEGRDVIVSGSEADWTVCLDREVRLKEAVQSRTLFLTEVESWKEVVPLLGPRVQTLGLAFSDQTQAEQLAFQAGSRGVARCVRPGLMNLYDSPWDGHFLFSELLNWVSWRP